MEQNPYAPPEASELATDENSQEYAGFWIRVVASIIDSVLILLVTMPILLGIYGMAYLESTTLVAGTWDFWIYRSATPGKMIVRAKIVDAKTGEKPSTGQLIGRYFGYYVSMIPLFLGFIWVAFDKRKQGWHDKLAGTVVVRR